MRPRVDAKGHPLTRQGVRDLGNSKPRGTPIPPKTKGDCDLDYKPPFKLMVSEDCGVHYTCRASTGDWEALVKPAKLCDKEGLRWVIEDSVGTIVSLSRIHSGILAEIGVVCAPNP